MLNQYFPTRPRELQHLIKYVPSRRGGVTPTLHHTPPCLPYVCCPITPTALPGKRVKTLQHKPDHLTHLKHHSLQYWNQPLSWSDGVEGCSGGGGGGDGGGGGGVVGGGMYLLQWEVRMEGV